MEPEEKDLILPEPEETECTDAAPEVSGSDDDIPETPAASAEEPAAEAEAEENAPREKPTLEILEDGSRILRIPEGYETFPDGWYPRNPVRRFMERWGAFLNLGLTLLLVAVLAAAALTIKPVRISLPEPTVPVPLPTEAPDPVPQPPEETIQPTMPDVPVQTGCFTAENGMLYFDREAFEPTPVLRLPDTVDGQQIVAIADGAFEGLSGVTSVLIPEGIRTLGDRAFAGCRDLRGVTLPDSTRSIGTEAFAGCPALEALCMPGSVVKIGDRAFGDCAALHYIFFNGPHSRWERLYTEQITPFTFIFCNDGEFPHGVQLPG